MLIPPKRMCPNAFLRFKKEKCPVQIPQTAQLQGKLVYVVASDQIQTTTKHQVTNSLAGNTMQQYLWVRGISFDTFRYLIFEFPIKKEVARKWPVFVEAGIKSDTGSWLSSHPFKCLSQFCKLEMCIHVHFLYTLYLYTRRYDWIWYGTHISTIGSLYRHM